jgi:hypothetical protein
LSETLFLEYWFENRISRTIFENRNALISRVTSVEKVVNAGEQVSTYLLDGHRAVEHSQTVNASFF